MIIPYLELVGVWRLFLIWSWWECGDYSLFGVGGSVAIIPYLKLVGVW